MAPTLAPTTEAWAQCSADAAAGCSSIPEFPQLDQFVNLHEWLIENLTDWKLILGCTLFAFGTAILMYVLYQLVCQRPDEHPAAAGHLHLYEWAWASTLCDIAIVIWYNGINFIVLAFLQSDGEKGRHSMRELIGAICAFAIIMNLAFGHALPHVMRIIAMKVGRLEAKEIKWVDEYDCNSCFMEFRGHLGQLFFTFMAQFFLFSAYIIFFLWSEYNWDDINYTLWFCSSITAQFYVYSTKPENARTVYLSHGSVWESLLFTGGKEVFVLDTVTNIEYHVPAWKIRLRWLVHFFMSGVMFFVILFTVPLVLGQCKTIMEYVTGVSALNFMLLLSEIDVRTFKIHYFNIEDFHIVAEENAKHDKYGYYDASDGVAKDWVITDSNVDEESSEEDDGDSH